MSRELDEKGETMQGEARIVVVEEEIEVGVIGHEEMATVSLELYGGL
jgi:hypothetical protein